MNAAYLRVGLDGCDKGSGYLLPRLASGAGNDRYNLYQAGDAVTELASGGTDQVHLFYATSYSPANRPNLERFTAMPPSPSR